MGMTAPIPTVGLTGEVDDKALPIGKDAGAGVRLELDGDIGAGGKELEAAAGTRVLTQDACCQVIPVIEGEDVPCAQPQPAACGEQGWGIKGCPPPGGPCPTDPHSHTDVQHDTLVLLHVQPPDAVLAFAVCLRPVGRQHHAGRVHQLPTAHRCRHTP